MEVILDRLREEREWKPDVCDDLQESERKLL